MSQSQTRLLSGFFTKSRQCHDFRRNYRQLFFPLKVRYKDKSSISAESLYYFKENQKGRKRSERHIRYKIPTKAVSKARVTLAFVRREIFVFKNTFLVRDDKHVKIKDSLLGEENKSILQNNILSFLPINNSFYFS